MMKKDAEMKPFFFGKETFGFCRMVVCMCIIHLLIGDFVDSWYECWDYKDGTLFNVKCDIMIV